MAGSGWAGSRETAVMEGHLAHTVPSASNTVPSSHWVSSCCLKSLAPLGPLPHVLDPTV